MRTSLHKMCAISVERETYAIRNIYIYIYITPFFLLAHLSSPHPHCCTQESPVIVALEGGDPYSVSAPLTVNAGRAPASVKGAAPKKAAVPTPVSAPTPSFQSSTGTARGGMVMPENREQVCDHGCGWMAWWWMGWGWMD